MIDNTWLPTVTVPRYRLMVPSEIVPGVWIGDRLDGKAAWDLPDWTVIDVREDDTADVPLHVKRIPLLRKDTRYQAGIVALREIADAIDSALSRGQKVIVHCWAGVERSPLSVAGWLVLRRGYTLDEAYAQLRSRRAVANRTAWLTKRARRELGGQKNDRLNPTPA